ncbi:MAG TPA: hypothetical protein VF604_09295 [Pyrinomonadaceae bacterium]|jgi:hypothetical protein
MAQTQKSPDAAADIPELEANEQTQTPFSRQAGYNQPLPHEENETAASSEQQIESTLEVKPLNPT